MVRAGMIRRPAAGTVAKGRRGSCAPNSNVPARWRGSSMPMSMMQIRIVRMLVAQGLMAMPVGMRLRKSRSKM